MADLTLKNCSCEEFTDLINKFFTKETEVTNQNLISVAREIAQHKEQYPNALLISVSNSQGITLLAVHSGTSGTFSYLAFTDSDDNSIRKLAEFISSSVSFPIVSFMSRASSSNKLATFLNETRKDSDQKYYPFKELKLHKLEKVNQKFIGNDEWKGELVKYTDEDFAIACEYAVDFEYDIQPNSLKRPELKEKLIREKFGETYVNRRKHAIFFWKIENGSLPNLNAKKLVSICAIPRETDNVASIGYVYTPAPFRSNRFASRMVAALSQNILDRGRIPILFTNASNEISNKIYKEVGFEYVCDFIHFKLGDAPFM